MRILASIALALACVLAAVAAIPNPDDAIAISGIIQDRLHATDISVKMVQEKAYAIAYWSAGDGYGAGEALIKKTKSNWSIVEITTGKFTASRLEGLGVPAATAEALSADLKVAASPGP
ncbi:MAG TPA: hypothetical protein VEW74_07775 [Candidatus Nitrosotalea sp.]|nr:hypothetical protein [Candidatus Nitrosotalea sp.]